MSLEPTELVARFASGDGTARFASYQALVDLGDDALPALRQGLKSGDWQTRRWSAICLDQLADAETLLTLVPLLRDPHPKVRLWAVHSLACDHCKDGVRCVADVVPLLIDRVLNDTNLRVRRMAVIMLGSELADRRAIPVLEDVLAHATDARLLLHARRGLQRLKAMS